MSQRLRVALHSLRFKSCLCPPLNSHLATLTGFFPSQARCFTSVRSSPHTSVSSHRCLSTQRPRLASISASASAQATDWRELDAPECDPNSGRASSGAPRAPASRNKYMEPPAGQQSRELRIKQICFMIFWAQHHSGWASNSLFGKGALASPRILHRNTHRLELNI